MIVARGVKILSEVLRWAKGAGVQGSQVRPRLRPPLPVGVALPGNDPCALSPVARLVCVAPGEQGQGGGDHGRLGVVDVHFDAGVEEHSGW